MKKLSAFFIIIISLSILISCNSKKETPPPQTDIISEIPIVETEQTSPQQNWKESLFSEKEITTQEDINAITAIIEKAVKNNNLEELQTFLETEAVKDKVPPQILFGLSLVYGRKGLVKEEYETIEKLEEQVKQRPGIAFNLSLVYGRKETLKSQIDKAEAEALALLQGFISILSEPTGAEIYIDGEIKGTTPFTSGGLKEGSYTIEIQMKDYKTVNRTVSVKAGETTSIKEKFVLLPGRLTVNSEPSGSTVLMSGEKIGITPFNIPEIVPGNYVLTITKENYIDEILPVTIKPGGKKIITSELVAITGNIYINSLSDGAKVFLDGRKVYPQMGWLKNVPTGDHSLSIRKDNYEEKKYTFTIKSKQTEYVSGLFIFSVPYATIKIDGKLDDWNDIEPAFIDPYGDQTDNISGTDIIKTFLAKDDTYLYFRMDFSNGKPSSKKEMIYECVVWADIISSGGQYFIEIRLQGNDSNRLKPIISIRKLKNNQNTNVKWNETGSIKIGDSFLEARFPLSAFKKYISNELSYNTEIRSWRGGSWDKSYDKVQKKLISFFSD